MATRAKLTTFSFLALWSYLLYGIGNATPYLRDDLHLSSFQAGLHASMLALGVLVAGVSAGVTADVFGRRIERNILLDLTVAGFGGAVGLIVLGPSPAFSLPGAFVMGLGGGTLGMQATIDLAEEGSSRARRLLSQANAFSMLTAGAAPLAIGLAAGLLHSWRPALALPIVGFVALAVLRPRVSSASTLMRTHAAPLPGSYWIVWLLLVIGVALEFSFVCWGSTIVRLRTGASQADATLLAALFVLGMFTVRTMLGRGFGTGRSHQSVLAGSMILVGVGAGLTWISTSPILSGAGLLFGGAGVASLWPVGMTMALETARGGQLQAAARATLGSGLAILVAPAALGLASDAAGVVAAWPMILGLAACGLGVVWLSGRPTRASTA